MNEQIKGPFYKDALESSMFAYVWEDEKEMGKVFVLKKRVLECEWEERHNPQRLE